MWRARVRAFAEGPEAARVSLDRPPAAASVSLSVKSRAAEALRRFMEAGAQAPDVDSEVGDQAARVARRARMNRKGPIQRG